MDFRFPLLLLLLYNWGKEHSTLSLWPNRFMDSCCSTYLMTHNRMYYSQSPSRSSLSYLHILLLSHCRRNQLDRLPTHAKTHSQHINDLNTKHNSICSFSFQFEMSTTGTDKHECRWFRRRKDDNEPHGARCASWAGFGCCCSSSPWKGGNGSERDHLEFDLQHDE